MVQGAKAKGLSVGFQPISSEKTLHNALIQKIIWLIKTQVSLKGSLADHNYQPWQEYARMGSKSNAPIYRHKEFDFNFYPNQIIRRVTKKETVQDNDESDSNENFLTWG